MKEWMEWKKRKESQMELTECWEFPKEYLKSHSGLKE